MDYGKVDVLSKDEKIEWEKVENICVGAIENGKKVYGSTLINGLLIDRLSYYPYETGHTYYDGETIYSRDKIESKPYAKVLFPTFVESIDYMIELKNENDSMINSGIYDIIISNDC